MASRALQEWQQRGLRRLTELESVHATLTGTRAGRQWGTTQLNRSLFVALCAQFQRYCRDLHDDGVAVNVAVANAAQRALLRQLLGQGRRLQTGNPRRSALGADFQRFGIDLVAALKARGPATVRRLDQLELLVDFRNAIGHGDEDLILALALEATGRIAATKASYLQTARPSTGWPIAWTNSWPRA